MGAPVERRSARVLVLDPAGRLLLLRGRDPGDPAAGEWWFTPGGGLDPGEDHEAAAVRELWEETGLQGLALSGPVAERTAEFTFEGVAYRQHERFFLARVPVPAPAVVPAARTALEERALLGWRWWPAAELAATTDTVHPDWLRGWRAGAPPPG